VAPQWSTRGVVMEKDRVGRWRGPLFPLAGEPTPAPGSPGGQPLVFPLAQILVQVAPISPQILAIGADVPPVVPDISTLPGASETGRGDA